MDIGWSLGPTSSPLQTLKELRYRSFWFYIKYVNMYTGRDLTKPKDVLAAFQGISQLFDRYTKAPSLFGLPTSHFDLALLWSPSAALCRRRLTLITDSMVQCTQDAMGNCICHAEKDAFGGSEFPSWAWSGWMGGPVEYQSKMLEGCLLNSYAWLKFHTWIQWHVRDEKGYLRPLWEIAMKSPKAGSEDDGHAWSSGDEILSDDVESIYNRWKWMGYPGCYDSSDVASISDGSSTGVAPQRTSSPASVVEATHYTTNDSSKDNKGRKTRTSPFFERASNRYYLARGSGWDRPHRQRHTWGSFQAIRALGNAWVNPAVAYLKSGAAYVLPESSDSESEIPNPSRERSRRVGKVSRDAKMKHSVSSDSDADRSSSEDDEIVVQKKPTTPHRFYKDRYGRRISSGIPKKTTRFQAILPDNPFGVIRQPRTSENPSKEQYRPILQFFTWRTEFHVAIRKIPANGISLESDSELCQCDIADDSGDWCGSIVLPKDWIGKREGSLFPFIAISDAKRFTEEECPSWTYYIPVERDESEWDLYFVLLLERNKERGVWERVGLGKVFQLAFRKGTWDEVKLG